MFREINNNNNRAERQFVVPIELTRFVLSLAPYRLLNVFHFLSLEQKQELCSHLCLSLQSNSDQKRIINLKQILLFVGGQLGRYPPY